MGAQKISSIFVDRRVGKTNKQHGNAERYKSRNGEAVRRKMDELLKDRTIADVDAEADVVIRPETDEFTFVDDADIGDKGAVVPGNDEYLPGDTIPHNRRSGGQGGSTASDSDEGEDEFVFRVSKDEFQNYLFDELELPRMWRKMLMDSEEYRRARVIHAKTGTRALMSIPRTYMDAKKRRIASGETRRGREILELEEEIAEYLAKHGIDADDDVLRDLRERLEKLYAKHAPAFMDMDVVNRVPLFEPVPIAKAVMFCIMDVSGSMDEERKSIAKRFFILLYLFLRRNYGKGCVDVVFIRHHTVAQEVDEETFFHATATGGTVVSTALELLEKIHDERYASGEWNCYAAQASDGDNFPADSERCKDMLLGSVLQKLQHYAYIEIAESPQDLWKAYETVYAMDDERKFAMQRVQKASEIYPVFRTIFDKKEA